MGGQKLNAFCNQENKVRCTVMGGDKSRATSHVKGSIRAKRSWGIGKKHMQMALMETLYKIRCLCRVITSKMKK